jgi:hypothetical protein
MINSVNRVYLGLQTIEKSVLCKFATKQWSERTQTVIWALMLRIEQHIISGQSVVTSVQNT